MHLLEEREKRRSLGARPKVFSPVTSDPSATVQSLAAVNKVSTATGGATFSEKVSGEGSSLNMLSLLKELRMSEENGRLRERREESSFRLRKNSSLDVDLFAEARKCIGLFPVKARHILDFHDGDYDISPDDIPQLPHLRLLAAEEFLQKEFKWNQKVEMTTNWSQDRNI